jgi:hypothetical protein
MNTTDIQNASHYSTASASTPVHLKPLTNLLRILEDLFFSMTIPEDIVFKYNILKENAYVEMGLTFDPIT